MGTREGRENRNTVAFKKFDLNIERILEDWEIHHAIREIIANAIDEQILTQTKDLEILKDKNEMWHVRDYGRGLRYEHLTQKENEEKLVNPHVIGKFGIGLKDALAIFDRKGVSVLIRSKHGDISIGKSEKHDFADIVTLHAYVSTPSDPKLVGTDFILRGVPDADVEKAEDLFLRFSDEREMETTKYGTVLRRQSRSGRIYINGVRVAEEENCLFSYNITLLTDTIRKALNRERTNVGRNAYSDRVKKILTSCRGNEVAREMVTDLKTFDTGETHEELKWVDVQEHAVKILNATARVLFLTPDELMTATNMVDEAKSAGFEIVIVPSNLKDRIKDLHDVAGNPIRELSRFYTEYNESFEFNFIDPAQLTSRENSIFKMTDKIFDLMGGKPRKISHVKISETMRRELGSFVEADGLWEPSTQSVIVKRNTLSTIERYAGTLLHEAAHAGSGTLDVSREFENAITRLMGIISARALE